MSNKQPHKCSECSADTLMTCDICQRPFCPPCWVAAKGCCTGTARRMSRTSTSLASVGQAIGKFALTDDANEVMARVKALGIFPEGKEIGIDLSPVCELCLGTGAVIVPGKGAKSCVPCSEKARAPYIESMIEKIPKRYRSVSLDTLKPRNDIHQLQSKLVAQMQAHPARSYYLCGNNDVGKSHLFWALYSHAVRTRRIVMACTLEELLTTIKNGFARGGDMNTDWVKLDRFRQSRYPCSVFLDDIDKARPTEFAAETFFALVDALYNFNHQVVVTTQLDPEESVDGRMSLIEHFAQADPRYANGIVRRICNETTSIWRLF